MTNDTDFLQPPDYLAIDVRDLESAQLLLPLHAASAPAEPCSHLRAVTLTLMRNTLTCSLSMAVTRTSFSLGFSTLMPGQI